MEQKNKTKTLPPKEEPTKEISISGGPGDVPVENVGGSSEELDGATHSIAKEGSGGRD